MAAPRSPGALPPTYGNNPMMRWMGLMFDKWVGADYETGLASLKELAEKEAGN